MSETNVNDVSVNGAGWLPRMLGGVFVCAMLAACSGESGQSAPAQGDQGVIEETMESADTMVDEARDAAAEAAEAAQERAREGLKEAQEAAGDLMEEAADKAEELGEEADDELKSALDGLNN